MKQFRFLKKTKDPDYECYWVFREFRWKFFRIFHHIGIIEFHPYGNLVHVLVISEKDIENVSIIASQFYKMRHKK